MEAIITSISMDGGTQSRAGIDKATVETFAEAMHAGDKFPPVIIYHDGKKYWLADGFHRVRAALMLGMDAIDATVKQGSREDAAWASCGANQEHDKVGFRRTNADKRRAVEMALRLHPEKNDQAIADHVGVSREFIRKVRPQVATVATSDEPTTRTGKDGKEYPTTHKPRTEPEPNEEPGPDPEHDDLGPDGTSPAESAAAADRQEYEMCAVRAITAMETINPNNPIGAEVLKGVAFWVAKRLEK